MALLLLTTAISFAFSGSEAREHRQMVALEAKLDRGQALSAGQLEALEDWREARVEQSLETRQANARERIEELRNATTWGATWRAWVDDMVEAVTLGPESYQLYVLSYETNRMLVALAWGGLGISRAPN